MNERNCCYLSVWIFWIAFIWWAYCNSAVFQEWCIFAAAMSASDICKNDLFKLFSSSKKSFLHMLYLMNARIKCQYFDTVNLYWINCKLQLRINKESCRVLKAIFLCSKSSAEWATVWLKHSTSMKCLNGKTSTIYRAVIWETAA